MQTGRFSEYGAPSTPLRAPPSNVSAVAQGTDTVRVTWDTAATWVTGDFYDIYVLDASGAPAWGPVRVHDDTGSKDVVGLTPGATYSFQVQYTRVRNGNYEDGPISWPTGPVTTMSATGDPYVRALLQ